VQQHPFRAQICCQSVQERRARPKGAAPAVLTVTAKTQFVFTLVGFLFGIVHESPLQQHEAPLLALQQACAFLPRFVFFLQHDMAPLLQQFSMSQHASEF
jgi:hypothetical protein